MLSVDAGRRLILGSLLYPLHAWMKNSLGLFSSVGQLVGVNSDIKPSIPAFLLSTPYIASFLSPWDIMQNTNAAYLLWSLVAISWAIFWISRPLRFCLISTLKWRSLKRRAIAPSSTLAPWRCSSPKKLKLFIIRQIPRGAFPISYRSSSSASVRFKKKAESRVWLKINTRDIQSIANINQRDLLSYLANGLSKNALKNFVEQVRNDQIRVWRKQCSQNSQNRI